MNTWTRIYSFQECDMNRLIEHSIEKLEQSGEIQWPRDDLATVHKVTMLKVRYEMMINNLLNQGKNVLTFKIDIDGYDVGVYGGFIENEEYIGLFGFHGKDVTGSRSWTHTVNYIENTKTFLISQGVKSWKARVPRGSTKETQLIDEWGKQYSNYTITSINGVEYAVYDMFE